MVIKRNVSFNIFQVFYEFAHQNDETQKNGVNKNHFFKIAIVDKDCKKGCERQRSGNKVS